MYIFIYSVWVGQTVSSNKRAKGIFHNPNAFFFFLINRLHLMCNTLVKDLLTFNKATDGLYEGHHFFFLSHLTISHVCWLKLALLFSMNSGS